MKLHYFQSQSHRAALAGIFLILVPNFFPNLFHPLGRAYPSLFSNKCKCLMSSYHKG
ncbi:hypothetical protein HanPI659440_Chr05g0218701 [Helianthus annuus]|nr:hypothetical protein HanPI659440_Chr05g0218701 [Helianthus annuus]